MYCKNPFYYDMFNALSNIQYFYQQLLIFFKKWLSVGLKNIVTKRLRAISI